MGSSSSPARPPLPGSRPWGADYVPIDPAPLPAGMDDKELERAGLELLRKYKNLDIDEGYASDPLPLAGSSAAASRSWLNRDRIFRPRAVCDPIFEYPATGAAVYCGGWSAADNVDELGRRNIRRVVNCQDPDSENFFEGMEVTYEDKPFRVGYLRFHINGLERDVHGQGLSMLYPGSLRRKGRGSGSSTGSGSPKRGSGSSTGSGKGEKSSPKRDSESSTGSGAGEKQTSEQEEQDRRIYYKFKDFFDFVDEGLRNGRMSSISWMKDCKFNFKDFFDFVDEGLRNGRISSISWRKDRKFKDFFDFVEEGLRNGRDHFQIVMWQRPYVVEKNRTTARGFRRNFFICPE